MKITRRKLAAALAVPALAPAAAQAPAAADGELKAAQENNLRLAAIMKKSALPMSAEPAFVFKA